jgi:hypothetical protein
VHTTTDEVSGNRDHPERVGGMGSNVMNRARAWHPILEIEI